MNTSNNRRFERTFLPNQTNQFVVENVMTGEKIPYRFYPEENSLVISVDNLSLLGNLSIKFKESNYFRTLQPQPGRLFRFIQSLFN